MVPEIVLELPEGGRVARDERQHGVVEEVQRPSPEHREVAVIVLGVRSAAAAVEAEHPDARELPRGQRPVVDQNQR